MFSKLSYFSSSQLLLVHIFIFKDTTDTNNHNSCMTKPILPYNVNMNYHIDRKLTEINGIGIPDTIMVNLSIYIFQQMLLPQIIILKLLKKCIKVSKSTIT